MPDRPEEPRLATRPVVLYPDPVLRRKAVPVRAVDGSVRALVEEMFRLMDAEDGARLLGLLLAAVDDGLPRREIVGNLAVVAVGCNDEDDAVSFSGCSGDGAAGGE